MRDSVPSASYSSVCNVLRQWNIPLRAIEQTRKQVRFYGDVIANFGKRLAVRYRISLCRNDGKPPLGLGLHNTINTFWCGRYARI